MSFQISEHRGQFGLWGTVLPRTPEEIIAEAQAFKPVAIFALFSGGDDSLVSTHWYMNNVPGCEVATINTGIGLEVTRRHVRDTCVAHGWKLTEIRAKEDCGQDYDEIVERHGFPGPASHGYMYSLLKERAVRKLVRDRKTKASDRVLLLTGIRHDESDRRSGYGGAEVTRVGAQVWVNGLYWVPQSEFHRYRAEHNLKRGPASEALGMSGECLCGAFATPGELAGVRLLEPETADRIERIECRARAAGHTWGWEGRPPPRKWNGELSRETFEFAPMLPLCTSCMKSPEREA
jgi:3'-phosphoadenosine 5'-phosphosulfate sulfotransferase (PAPS reductase)/FAD synthetase